MSELERELEEKGYIVYTNKGYSMMPLLRQDKDLMYIEKKTDGYKKNDAALFKRDNGSYVLHRIVGVKDDGYYFLGDNCIKKEFVRSQQVLGILSAVIRDGKSISVHSFKYKLYVFFLPLRRILIKINRKIRG